jgi:hypothetical protein
VSDAPESTRARRERLAPVLAQLDAMGRSVFLDLCELLLMLADRIDGSIKWEHPRVTVYIKRRKTAKGVK